MQQLPDSFAIFTILLVVDGLLTVVNLCVLGLTLKLYTEWNKVWRMTQPTK